MNSKNIKNEATGCSSLQSFATIDIDAALERLNGSRAMLGALATFFVEDAPPLMQRLHEALQSSSYSQIARVAHGLRGLAATFEATPFIQLTSEIEDRGRLEDSSNSTN